jgi:serine protease Do
VTRGERIRLVHLSGPRAGQTDEIARLPLSIGSGPDVDVSIPGVGLRHCLLFAREAEVVVLDSGSGAGTHVAGQPVPEAVLQPGDVLELGPGGPRLRFEREVTRDEVAARREGGRRLSDTAAFRVVQGTSRSFRRAVLALSLLALAVLGWSSWDARRMRGEIKTLRQAVLKSEQDRRAFEDRVDAERRRAADDRTGFERQLAEFRAREQELQERLALAATGEVITLREELTTTRGRIQALESERAAGENVIRRYGAGVCLLQGSFAFHDAAGRPLRVRMDESGRPRRDPDGGSSLEAEGGGPVHTVEYYGTGFLVEPGGLILTNRHVAEPWWQDDAAEEMEKAGFYPRLVKLRAFFPQQPAPFEARLERRADKVDLALLRVDLRGTRIPVLPLERSLAGAVPGQPVVVVGYPAGLEAILAKAESNVVAQILESHGTDSDQVTEALSLQGLIRPSTTQGHIGDVTTSDIVYDAPTTQGGSGGPVFNKHGQVIAVEYAVLPKFGGNSFGVPIAYAVELLSGLRRRPGD